MKTRISYQDISERGPIEREVGRQAAKLERRLKKFHPDLVDLHVSLRRRVRPTMRYTASLALYLPPRQLHASEEAAQPALALKYASAELLRELKKLTAKLRGEDKLRKASRLRRQLR